MDTRDTPASVNRADALAAIRALGFNPDVTARMEFEPGTITAVLYERDADGRKMLTGDRQHARMYEVEAPIVDDDSEPT